MGDDLLEALESRFVMSPTMPNIWMPTWEGRLAILACPEELEDTFDLSDDQVVQAIAPGTELTQLFDWEWSGMPSGGIWIEVARLGERDYLQLNGDSGEETKVIAAIAAGSDADLNNVFAKLLSTNGAAFDAELMASLPDLLTNFMPHRLRREVVSDSQHECCRRLDDYPAEVAGRISIWAERGEPGAPEEEWLAHASDDAIFEAWFDLVYSER
jgi:hypothetical protein